MPHCVQNAPCSAFSESGALAVMVPAAPKPDTAVQNCCIESANRPNTTTLTHTVTARKMVRRKTTSVRLEVEQNHLVRKWGGFFLGVFHVEGPQDGRFLEKGDAENL